MKAAIFSSKYFLGLSFLIFICFAAIGLFMTSKFQKHTENISIELATKVFQLKANVIRQEFNSFLEGLSQAEVITREMKTDHDFYRLKPSIGALLIGHPKMQQGWYAIATPRDTIFGVWNKNDTLNAAKALPAAQQQWIKKQLSNPNESGKSGALIKEAETTYWLNASHFSLTSERKLVFGLAINLKALQEYLWSVDSIGRASAFIIDEQGYYITNQQEELIGQRMLNPQAAATKRTLLADSVSSYEIVQSSYLQLPVVRYYTPLNIGAMRWTMVVDTPILAVDEDVKVIENYVWFMFIFTALLILLLIAWFQSKWQKEFMLRQQAEITRQELSLEKQALRLTAERQQKENAILQLESLKEKVDPHFLFNSLSSLNGLIQEQPALAKSFVVKLSKVYRYVLDPAPDGLAPVSKELQFANEYFFLLKIRFGDALAPLTVNISPEHLQGDLPFMSLQTLVENAVKHNIVSKVKPLQIRIYSDHRGICVSNNYQPRDDVKVSGKQGLHYLQQVYAHFSDYKLEHGADQGNYVVSLPIINITFTP
jgi:two-component system LytT family sensor kinase